MTLSWRQKISYLKYGTTMSGTKNNQEPMKTTEAIILKKERERKEKLKKNTPTDAVVIYGKQMKQYLQ